MEKSKKTKQTFNHRAFLGYFRRREQPDGRNWLAAFDHLRGAYLLSGPNRRRDLRRPVVIHFDYALCVAPFHKHARVGSPDWLDALGLGTGHRDSLRYRSSFPGDRMHFVIQKSLR